MHRLLTLFLALLLGNSALAQGVVLGQATSTSMVATSAAGGISSTFRIQSATAGTNVTGIRAGPGRVYKVRGYNAATSVRYIKMYNTAAPTVGTTPALYNFAVPPSAGFSFDWGDTGYYHSVGMAVAFTTGPLDSDTSGVSAGDIVGFNIDIQ